MEGRVSVKSKPGEGSEFKVTLPIELIMVQEETSTSNEAKSQPLSTNNYQRLPAEALAQAGTTNKEISNIERPMSNVEVDSTKPHVLVAEDNADLRSFIIDSLRNEFHFLEAGNGKEGLDKATTEVPDLIISDVMMPEMDGITMTGKIKKDIRTSHIPVILLTAKTSEDSMLSGLGTGADDYLTKPFNKNELLLKVRNRIALQIKIRGK